MFESVVRSTIHLSKFIAMLPLLIFSVGCERSAPPKIAEQAVPPPQPAIVCKPDAASTECLKEMPSLRQNLASAKADLEKCQATSQLLRDELEDLKATPDALMTDANTSLANSQPDVARKRLETLIQRHPRSPLVREAKKLLQRMDDTDLSACVAQYTDVAKFGDTETGVDSAIHAVQACIEECPKCPSVRRARSLLGSLASRKKALPIVFQSLREAKLRYADLLEREVHVQGVLEADGYYNCAFDNPRRWRSFRLSDGNAFEAIHVYCDKDETCDTIFSTLAQGKKFRGTIKFKYPPRNSVCEADQAFLVGLAGDYE